MGPDVRIHTGALSWRDDWPCCSLFAQSFVATPLIVGTVGIGEDDVINLADELGQHLTVSLVTPTQV